MAATAKAELIWGQKPGATSRPLKWVQFLGFGHPLLVFQTVSKELEGNQVVGI